MGFYPRCCHQGVAAGRTRDGHWFQSKAVLDRQQGGLAQRWGLHLHLLGACKQTLCVTKKPRSLENDGGPTLWGAELGGGGRFPPRFCCGEVGGLCVVTGVCQKVLKSRKKSLDVKMKR